MTTSNLAAIFQPGILSHPQHDMSPQDYRLSQDVLIFLIDNQDHFLIGMEGTAVDEGTVKHIESGPPTPQARTPTTPGRNNSGIGRSASTSSSAGAESLRKYGGVRRNVSTSSKRSRHSGAVPSPITPAFATPSASGVHRSNTLPSKRSPALGSPRFPAKQSGPSTPVAEEVKSPLSSTTTADASESNANAKQEPAQSGPVAPTTQPIEPIAEQQRATPHNEPEQTLPKRAQTMPPQKIDMPKPFAQTEAQQVKPPAVTPALDKIPGAFPPPSPSVIPPSEPVTPNVASSQAAQSLLPPGQHSTSARSPHHTPTRERSEFLEGSVDSGPSADPSPAVRTFTQILSKVAASPSNENKDGRKPNKLQKKRIPSSANPSAQSSTHSLTGGESGFSGPQLPATAPLPMQPPQAMPMQPLQGMPMHQPKNLPMQPPQSAFVQGQSQGASSKDPFQSYNNETASSRNSGTTLKPTMSPSASFRSHSTATEFSETDQTEDMPREEKRSFWKSHKRGESKATPTASQTDLHGSVPGGDKSMSSFASSSGWTGDGRRSLQYDSHQSSGTSMPYGSPPDHDKPEKKSAFDWFHKMRQDHKERGDKRERAKSPPGSASHLPAPQNLMQPPQENPANRGRSMDIPRSTDNTRQKAEQSNDVTPTESSPNPPIGPLTSASNTAAVPSASSPAPGPVESSPKPSGTPVLSSSNLPAALTEPKSVARSPERASVSEAQPAPVPQPLQVRSGSHHASSNSTVTITPDRMGDSTTAPEVRPPTESNTADFGKP